MAYPHAPLTDDMLGPLASKFAGEKSNDASRMMLARGLVPLPPEALLAGLYHVWVNSDWESSPVAEKTLSKLPETTILGALGKRSLDAGIVDFIARKFGRNKTVLEKVVLHTNVDDETLVGISRSCPDSICDMLAENQERWMKCPEIVVGLYNNRGCRMSVIHRVLEFASRNGIEIKLPMMEEIKAAIAEEPGPDPERDQIFADRMGGGAPALADEEEEEEDLFREHVEATGEVVAETSVTEDDSLPPYEEEPEKKEPETEEVNFASRTQELMAMNTMEKIRAALLGEQTDRAFLIKDSNKIVAMAVIKSPKIKENEVVGYSSNRSLSPDVIRYIAGRREWVKLYQVKINLVMNPKTPLARALSFLPFLKNNDVKKLARSKNIPAALAKAAKRKIQGQR
ncbi:MAG: hypothetical protein ACPHRO_00815 [Nannocystaceae bacterium]